jgi:hypothetical protein
MSPCSCANASARDDLPAELEHLADAERAAADEQLVQVLALDVLEDDERLAAVVAAIDHGHDARVRELGDRARLAAEALDVVVVVRVLIVQDLQRDDALERAVARSVDARHPAGADHLLELVAIRDHLHHRERVFPAASLVKRHAKSLQELHALVTESALL